MKKLNFVNISRLILLWCIFFALLADYATNSPFAIISRKTFSLINASKGYAYSASRFQNIYIDANKSYMPYIRRTAHLSDRIHDKEANHSVIVADFSVPRLVTERVWNLCWRK